MVTLSKPSTTRGNSQQAVATLSDPSTTRRAPEAQGSSLQHLPAACLLLAAVSLDSHSLPLSLSPSPSTLSLNIHPSLAGLLTNLVRLCQGAQDNDDVSGSYFFLNAALGYNNAVKIGRRRRTSFRILIYQQSSSGCDNATGTSLSPVTVTK